ncbi:DUF2742 domain-containing protein [Mycobacterium hodleri]|uniref:DUF2742 domain-containing protein n=1 Tax=Mycolicibacterium hodleri TaxID=49897 RepID=UPI0021F2755C|nr:DUF2742 domain-containing protein [Mycolicibacterium hodleri]MCV7136156.1 DUF2742 domain-containing protein [Mycolicibacterium hodleri]
MSAATGPPGPTDGDGRTWQPGHPLQHQQHRPATKPTDAQHDSATWRHVTSRQVNHVLDVCLFAAPLIGDPDGLPWPGTAEWMNLCDADKRRSLLRAGVVATLNEDAHQAAMRQAAQAIRDSEDWAAVARRQAQRRTAIADGAYIPRVVVS